jgi:YihY family inner membrane protein
VVERVVAWLDAWQRRHTPAGFPIAVAKKFGEDRASSLAALIAYYAFVSLFPLLLAFVSILGFVLDGNPELRQQVIDSTLARIPVLGDQLNGAVQPLSGSGVALAVGLGGALWAGLGVTVALQQAFAEVWDVPRLRQPNGIKTRLRGFAVLAILGVLLIASTAAAGLAVGGGLGHLAERAATMIGALAVNGAALLIVFRLLTVPSRPLRALLPGVALAAVGTLALQSLGGWYVNHVILDATATYGAFALVIGLLSWFLLASNLLLVAAEINVILEFRLWPRSLAGELAPADRRALERAAEATRMDLRERVSVGFTGPDER